MTIVLGIAIAILILVIIQLLKKRERKAIKRRRAFYAKAPNPATTGKAKSASVRALWSRLEQSLPSSYADAVRSRTLQEHPEMSEQEFAWRWHELKRFFILCSLMDRVPMFSPRVDELWHQMLMFTREYERFSNDFFGRMLHHAPHAGSQPMPEERAWFDVVYVKCFGWNKYSADLWGRFFTEPLPKEELELYTDKSAPLEQTVRWNMNGYRNRTEIKEAIDWLMRRIRAHVYTAKRSNEDDLIPVSYSHPEALLFTAIWYSMNEPQEFQVQMAHPEEVKTRGHSGSGCSSASGCGYSDSRDHDSSSSGHDSTSSSSSCSSGSSCSSSSGCGGGGGD